MPDRTMSKLAVHFLQRHLRAQLGLDAPRQFRRHGPGEASCLLDIPEHRQRDGDLGVEPLLAPAIRAQRDLDRAVDARLGARPIGALRERLCRKREHLALTPIPDHLGISERRVDHAEFDRGGCHITLQATSNARVRLLGRARGDLHRLIQQSGAPVRGRHRGWLRGLARCGNVRWLHIRSGRRGWCRVLRWLA
jgi:hypothetical protein